MKPLLNTASVFWFFLGLAVTLAALTFLEWRIPFYFVSDDNHRQYLPVILSSLHRFFATGNISWWDPYTGLGSVLINGAYGLSYPPLYLSYAIAAALGNAALTLDVFAFLHFAAAYAVMYAALRRMHASAMLAACASAGYALCGYHLIQGRSWMNVEALPLYLAALLYLLTFPVAGERLKPRWALLLALTLGAFYHLGHPQFWLYGVISFSAAYAWTLWAHGRRGLRNFPMVLAGLLGALAVAAPLLWVQWLEQQYVSPLYSLNQRTTGWDAGISRAWPFLFYPCPQRGAWCAALFSGGIYDAAALGLGAFALSAIFRHRRPPPEAAYILAAALCLTFSFGDAAPLWTLTKTWPVFNKFRYADKWVPFLIVFITAAGVAFLVRISRFSPAARRVVNGCALIGLAASIYNAMNCTGAAFMFADKPYPALPPELISLRAAQSDGAMPYRLLSVGPEWSPKRNFVLRLNNNYPAYYGIFSANRYPQRVTTSPEMLAALALAAHRPSLFLKRFSVSRVFTVNEPPGMQVGPDYDMNALFNAAGNNAIAERALPEIGGSLLFLNTAETDPLVGLYAPGNAVRTLPFSVLPNGISIDLSQATPQGAYVIAAFLTHRWFHAYAEPGHTPLMLEYDPFHRLKVMLDHPARRIKLLLEPPWDEGWLISAAAALLALLCGFAASRKLP